MKKRRFGLMSKLAMLIFAVYAAMTLLLLQVQLNEKRERKAELELQVAQQRTINQKSLSEATDYEPGDEDIRRIAREKFGLVDPGEIVFVDISR